MWWPPSSNVVVVEGSNARPYEESSPIKLYGADVTPRSWPYLHLSTLGHRNYIHDLWPLYDGRTVDSKRTRVNK